MFDIDATSLIFFSLITIPIMILGYYQIRFLENVDVDEILDRRIIC
jgi:hypothetical protein